ncbi:LOW QUALITY PROTEIN: hypothetical protein OOU_Y34scaffold00768g13 [Pyricularia oryzae Y34]|uniref:Uncharacterized protein n=2 Tax=Pyricularia oryzae TaxID=318829 RepID=A0AA97PH31_PYRO3|nr:LOW QUALITY PROTEIN: hypothetical protein OOU_Y34scaffold00768g13 [Pyricularia oryzae Y34]
MDCKSRLWIFFSFLFRASAHTETTPQSVVSTSEAHMALLGIRSNTSCTVLLPNPPNRVWRQLTKYQMLPRTALQIRQYFLLVSSCASSSILICGSTYPYPGGISRKSRYMIGQDPNEHGKGYFEVHIVRHRVLIQVNVAIALPIEVRSLPTVELGLDFLSIGSNAFSTLWGCQAICLKGQNYKRVHPAVIVPILLKAEKCNPQSSSSYAQANQEGRLFDAALQVSRSAELLILALRSSNTR